MDSSLRCRPCLLPNPTHNHHHHHQHHPQHHHHPLIFSPHHHHHHHHCNQSLHHLCHHCYHHLMSHLQLSPSFASPPQNPEPAGPVTLPTNSLELKETHDSAAQVWQEQEPEGLEEDEEEPIFVLTDEWMEFFAKSEAKRKLEKKLAKKKGKN